MARRAIAIGTTLIVLAGGYLAADVADLVPGPLTTEPPRTPVAAPVVPGLRSDTGSQVLSGLSSTAPEADAATVASVLDPLVRSKALGKNPGVEVRDAISGDSLYSRRSDRGYLPASTTKLLTATAALSALGQNATLRTEVVAGPGADEVTLVGGGDMLLGTGRSNPDAIDGRAGLATLARRTAEALRSQGRKSIAVRLDDSLYSGASVSPEWASDDVSTGQVAPISALMVDSGQTKPGQRTPRASDPSMFAARAFVAALSKNGIRVVDGPDRATAQNHATKLASVSSAPIGEIVRYMLLHSDNVVAEGLGRLVALHEGSKGTFLDAAATVTSVVADLGVSLTGVTLKDVSGLSHRNRITPLALTEVLRAAATAKNRSLSALIPSLPVAGLSGTLAERYDESTTSAGAGLVRAKTGSLRGVNTLAGVVTDASGRLVVFAVMANDVPDGGAQAAHTALDAITSAVTRCGCRTGAA